MQNIGVSHDISKFDDKTRILTLEDKSMLDDTPDVLQCSEIREDEKALRNTRRKAKLPDTEDVYGDRLLPGIASVLPHYDDAEPDLSKAKFSIPSNSEWSDQKEQNTSEGNSTANRSEILKDLYVQRHLSSDFISRDEADALAGTNRGLRTILKKRRKIRKETDKKVEENAPLEESIKVVSRGNRKKKGALKDSLLKSEKKCSSNQKEKGGKELLEQERRRQMNEARRAKLAERKLFSQIREKDLCEESEEENTMLSLAESPRNALNYPEELSKRARSAAIKNTTKLKESLIKQERDYNETAAFLEGIGTEATGSQIEAHIKSSPIKLSLRDEEKAIKSEQLELDGIEKDEVIKKDGNSNSAGPEKRILGSEPLASSSVADALKLFKRRGLLKKRDSYDYVGRPNDERIGFFKEEERASDVRLEYLDASTGRPLSRREAFRQMSHIFHGRKPSDTKKAKLSRKMENRRQRKEKTSTETPMGLVSKAKKFARKTGKAYVHLDGNRNAAVLKLTKT